MTTALMLTLLLGVAPRMVGSGAPVGKPLNFNEAKAWAIISLTQTRGDEYAKKLRDAPVLLRADVLLSRCLADSALPDASFEILGQISPEGRLDGVQVEPTTAVTACFRTEAKSLQFPPPEDHRLLLIGLRHQAGGRSGKSSFVRIDEPSPSSVASVLPDFVYPIQALAQGIGGTATVHVLINSDGKPTVELEKSSGRYDLDAEAIDNAERAVYVPMEDKSVRAYPLQMRIPYAFKPQGLSHDQAEQVANFSEVIASEINDHWKRPSGLGPSVHCVVEIIQSKDGTVVDARTLSQCQLDPLVRQSLIDAVKHIDTLPWNDFSMPDKKGMTHLVFDINAL